MHHPMENLHSSLQMRLDLALVKIHHNIHCDSPTYHETLFWAMIVYVDLISMFLDGGFLYKHVIDIRHKHFQDRMVKSIDHGRILESIRQSNMIK
jgi:hypothetical protein